MLRRRLYLAMGRSEAGSVIWLHSSSITTGNFRAFRHGKGQAAQVTPTTLTFGISEGKWGGEKFNITSWFISVQVITAAGEHG